MNRDLLTVDRFVRSVMAESFWSGHVGFTEDGAEKGVTPYSIIPTRHECVPEAVVAAMLVGTSGSIIPVVLYL